MRALIENKVKQLIKTYLEYDYHFDPPIDVYSLKPIEEQTDEELLEYLEALTQEVCLGAEYK